MLMMVSAIIPMFNVAWCISTQIEALRIQDYKYPWELILVDNGSNDNTISICNKLILDYPVQVHLISATSTAGTSYARNAGINHSNGDLLCFCDADDRVGISWITELVEAYEKGVLVAGYNRTWNGIDTPNNNKLWCSGAKCHLGGHPIAMGCNMLISKEDAAMLQGFDSRFQTGQDADFSWRYVKAGGKIKPCSEAKIDYRERCSIIANFTRHFKYGVDDIKLMKHHANWIRFNKNGHGHPRFMPPIIATVHGFRTRKTGGYHHIARSMGKYFGHAWGCIRHSYYQVLTRLL
jgi:glycosyltransferase involved in cell wall biosynthesis